MLARIGLNIKRSLGMLNPPAIVPYRGFGNEHFAQVMGHVLENRYEKEVRDTDHKLQNIIGMAGRYMSAEIPDVRVRATFCGQNQTVKTDETGHFTIDFHFEKQNSNFR